MRLAILCSGQAGQHSTMLNDMLLAPDCLELREIASDILKQDVATWWHELNAVTLFENTNAQFSIALYQIAKWQRLSPMLPVTPIVVAGYSLGELIGWHVAGAIDVKDTLCLVRARAQLMNDHFENHQLGESCMALCRGRISPTQRAARDSALEEYAVPVAIYRPDGDFVLGAPARLLNNLMGDAKASFTEIKRLPVEVPSHTRWLKGAVEPFFNIVSAVNRIDPLVPIISGTDGSLQRQRSDAAISLSRQLAEPIRWNWCVETLASMAVDVAIELGPGNDLSRQFQSSIHGSVARSTDEFTDLSQMHKWLVSHT
jgi:[acyl-carrier-protein] S-malonyltransferase